QILGELDLTWRFDLAVDVHEGGVWHNDRVPGLELEVLAGVRLPEREVDRDLLLPTPHVRRLGIGRRQRASHCAEGLQDRQFLRQLQGARSGDTAREVD